jgi:hypothetical protein
MRKLLIRLLIILLFTQSTSSYAYFASSIIGNQKQVDVLLNIGTWFWQTLYDFSDTTIADMVQTGSNIVIGSFTDQTDSIRSSNGLIYIPNPNESYTITVRSRIISPGTGGGYGILFDSRPSNPTRQTDTGFALQFDRGYTNGEIIIRPRNNGTELSPVVRYDIRFDQNGNLTQSGGLKNNQNPWWMQEHEIKIQVSVINPQTSQKQANIYLDGIHIIQFNFTSQLFGSSAQDNVTGLRTWTNVFVDFYEVKIESS